MVAQIPLRGDELNLRIPDNQGGTPPRLTGRKWCGVAQKPYSNKTNQIFTNQIMEPEDHICGLLLSGTEESEKDSLDVTTSTSMSCIILAYHQTSGPLTHGTNM